MLLFLYFLNQSYCVDSAARRYIADHVYALGTIYFLCATLGVFVVSHFLNKYAPSSLKKSRLWRKAEAVARYVAYKGFQLPALRYWSPSLGVILLLLAGVVFFFGSFSFVFFPASQSPI